jgi:hypothetical protein
MLLGDNASMPAANLGRTCMELAAPSVVMLWDCCEVDLGVLIWLPNLHTQVGVLKVAYNT